MKIYVASRVKHAAMWRVRKENGCPIISSWIHEAGEGQTDDLAELWDRIRQEVLSADRLVLYVGQDDFPPKGALVEVGMALAVRIPVFLVLQSEVKASLEYPSLRPLGSWAKSSGVIWEDSLDLALSPDWRYRHVSNVE